MVKQKVLELFILNFVGDSYWRLNRAFERAIRRLSFEECGIGDVALNEFEDGRRRVDPSEGVGRMLEHYCRLYSKPSFADDIKRILDDTLSYEFNKLFFPLY